MVDEVNEFETRRMVELQKEVEAQPFAGAQDALKSGNIADGEDHRARRLLRNLTDESAVSRDGRIRLGSMDRRAPEFRRTQPRS